MCSSGRVESKYILNTFPFWCCKFLQCFSQTKKKTSTLDCHPLNSVTYKHIKCRVEWIVTNAKNKHWIAHSGIFHFKNYGSKMFKVESLQFETRSDPWDRYPIEKFEHLCGVQVANACCTMNDEIVLNLSQLISQAERTNSVNCCFIDDG